MTSVQFAAGALALIVFAPIYIPILAIVGSIVGWLLDL